MEICSQIYGEYSLLTSRLYINIGIVHEDSKDYVKAFDYFKKWARASETVYGPDHPKTLRAKGVLQEARYKLVAQRLKERHERGGDSAASTAAAALNADDAANIAPARDINSEVEQLLERRAPYDDVNIHVIDISSNDGGGGEAAGAEIGDDDDGDFDLQPMSEELQQAINDILRRALGQLDNRAEVLQNLLTNMTLTRANAGAATMLDVPLDRHGGSGGDGDDEHSDNENQDTTPEEANGSL